MEDREDYLDFDLTTPLFTPHNILMGEWFTFEASQRLVHILDSYGRWYSDGITHAGKVLRLYARRSNGKVMWVQCLGMQHWKAEQILQRRRYQVNRDRAIFEDSEVYHILNCEINVSFLWRIPEFIFRKLIGDPSVKGKPYNYRCSYERD